MRETTKSCTYMLAVVLVTFIIIWFEAVFWAQAELELAHNTKRLVILIEGKSVEVKVTMIGTKSDL